MSKRGGRINSLNNKIKCSDRLQKKNFYFIILILILGLSFGTIFYLQLGPEINHLNKDIENALDAYSLGNIQRTDLIKTFFLSNLTLVSFAVLKELNILFYIIYLIFIFFKSFRLGFSIISVINYTGAYGLLASFSLFIEAVILLLILSFYSTKNNKSFLNKIKDFKLKIPFFKKYSIIIPKNLILNTVVMFSGLFLISFLYGCINFRINFMNFKK